MLYALPPAVMPAGHGMMQPPCVPADKLADARALTSPLPDLPDTIENGKALYNGKGTCFNCHGKDGGGDGAGALGLDPAPEKKFSASWLLAASHRGRRSFGSIKHGSPGTRMGGFSNVLTDEEIWAIIQYERTFAGIHGPRHGMGRGGEMGNMGPRGGMSHEGPPESKSDNCREGVRAGSMKRARRKVEEERKSSLTAVIAAVLLSVGVASFGVTSGLVSVVLVRAADHPVVVGDRPGAEAGLLNPHSDLIFRATGATSCLNCHRTNREGRLTARVQDNAKVQELKAKAKGIHGPGRFADCLRCHAGGDKGVENIEGSKYKSVNSQQEAPFAPPSTNDG